MTKEEEEKELNIEATKIGMQCYETFYFFFITFWPEMSGDKYIDAPHIKYICDVIQEKAMKVVNGEISMETLIINVPPGSSKSTIATIAFPMWIWLHAPYLATTNISYSATLSERHAKKARSITDSEKWKVLFDNIYRIKYAKKDKKGAIITPGKPLRITTQNQKEMVNNYKGERFNASVDGTITGMHADFIIKDDMQNPKQAKSDTERRHVNAWDEETLTSRHKNEMCYLDIIIAQRLHEDDLTGYTLNKDINITLVCLPSEVTNASKVSPASAIDIYTDGILDPNRRPRFVLDALKAKMTSGPYTTQYLQAPFNLEEQPITPAMFDIIDSCKENITWDVWIDSAYTEKTENDPTGIDIVARVGNEIIIKESYDVKMTLPKLVAFLIELGENEVFDKVKSRIFIEPKASGYSLYQYILTDTKFNCVLIGQNNKAESKLIQEGKTARHNMIKPKAESHRIKLLKGKWNDDFIVQICGFPRASHDEHVDTLGYAIFHYYMKENTFIAEHALQRLEKSVIGSIMTMVTSQVVKSRSGSSQTMAVDYDENDKGDVQMFDYPNAHYFNRYICSVVLMSESERSGVTCILVYDRLNKVVAAMHINIEVTPRKIAKKAMEMATLYDKAKLVICIKKDSGLSKNEGMDQSHMVIQEIRKIGYQNLHSRLAINDIKKTKREREYGFEINRSTSREVYLHLKDQLESNKIQELPMEVFEDVSVLERKKETGAIDGREGHEVNCGLAYATALKVNDEWGEKVNLKRSRGSDWTN